MKELKLGSLGWVVEIYMADVPCGTSVTAHTLFGRKDRKRVVLNPSFGEQLKMLWKVKKVCDWLLFMD